MQGTVGGGERSSSATAYLDPALGRGNIHVLLNNTVTRLLSSGSVDGKPSFRTVEFAPNASGRICSRPLAGLKLTAHLVTRSVISARKEIILSAGSIGTPQILMLSGIGDPDALTAAGIEPIVDLPDVGQHLRDHCFAVNYWTVSSNMTTDNVNRDPSIFNADLAVWLDNRTGQFATPYDSTIGYFRIPDSDPIWANVTDPTPGERWGD